ncbi:Dipeptidase 1 [Eumeta japonica]|uniref:Dipeptidase n=1 Tax=Eumeta variegata TaxID=151549 RepID=A0A4C1USI2_EUMVA|nr:Dipeptidase 1 [Eumeta japonica]
MDVPDRVLDRADDKARAAAAVRERAQKAPTYLNLCQQFWAAYVPCDSQHRDAVQLIFEQIDLIQRLTDKYHPQLTLCTSASDIVAAHANHRMCSLVGVEGGHAIGGSLGVLRTLYQVGVRYLTLTSTCDTPWAECASAAERPDAPPHGGLTPFGKVFCI